MVLASLTYAVAALRMSRRGALAQQLNAIESLAAADIVCTDKTGTLTEAALRVVAVVPARRRRQPSCARALGRYAASSPARNGTLEALAGRASGRGRAGGGARSRSRRVGAGARWRSAGARYVLGAPELLPLGPLRRAGGRRAAARPPRAGVRDVGEPAAMRTTTRVLPDALEPFGAGGARRAPAPGRARDGRVLPRAGRRAQGALRRRARDGRRDRRGRRHRRHGRPGGRERRRRGSGRARGRRALARGRADLAGGQAGGGGGAARRRAATSRWSATASTTCRR